jgi:ankyrin repeat protein
VQQLSNLDSIVDMASMKESEAESIVLKLGSQCNWEPFLEALPQLVLQCYIVLQMISNGSFAEDYSSIVLGSMVMSVVSISMAAGGSYLFERCAHPVPSNLVAKIFFGLFYLVIVGSRALSLATLGLLFKDHKWITVTYLSISMLVIVGGAKLAELRWPNTMASIHKWNPKISYERDRGIKGEYEEQSQRGFHAFIQETKMKSMFLGFFVPCIPISPNFYVFEISAILSTVAHLSGSIAGVSLCFMNNEYCLSNQTNSNGTSNTTISEDQSNEPNPTLQQMFIINICLLSLSAAGLGLISYLQYLPRFRKWMCGKFNHPSLIAIFVEEEAENEYKMEKEAKERNPDWLIELSKMRQEQLKTRETRLQEFEQLCKSIDTLDGDIIIRRKGNSTIKKTILQLLKELRWGEDFIGILLTHIHLKNINQKKVTSHGNDQTKSEDITMYNDDIHKLFQKIEKNMDDINTSNENGENGLMVGIKKKNKLAVELLLMNGASIMHTNKDEETAFEVGIDVDNEAINQLLWKYAKDNQEQYELFHELCSKGNLEAVKFCIENSSDTETKQLIEWNGNELKNFPLLICLLDYQTDVAKILINEHNSLNERFLCEGDVTGHNALMWSSRFGFLEIVELLLPIYIKYEKVTSQNNVGSSALHLSAFDGHTSIVQILVEHFKKENKIDAQDNYGKTAFDEARRNNHDDIVDILTKALEND